MFRISQFIRELDHPTPAGPRRNPPGPVVIWNLIRRCNLTCEHCYSISADKDFHGELNTEEVFKVTGHNRLLDVALELERIALQDDYFVSRKLYPNVDFYSGLIYRAMKLPASMFTVMFAVPRTCGWVAHWLELLTDAEQKISRPRQIHTGPDVRDYVPMDLR